MAKAKKDPNYVVPVSAQTLEDRRDAGKRGWDNKTAKAKKKALDVLKRNRATMARNRRKATAAQARKASDRQSRAMGGTGALTARQEKAFVRHCQALGPGRAT